MPNSRYKIVCKDCLGTYKYLIFNRRQRSPPPALLPYKLDELLASLSPHQARRIQISCDSIFWDDVPTHPDF
ncbi:hypothetical protein MYX84_13585 [Acidobacteria bacterium AH-259-O06]|nr:hypothetical protein [Acidobacteria bacterium AH-259-O06]